MKKIIIFLLILPYFGYSQILKKEIENKMVVLTFDDATASQYSVVAPILKQYGFGATFFICEFQPNFSDSAKYMNWRQIKELDKMGFEIANHTRSHPNVSKLSKADFLGELYYIENKLDSLNIQKSTSFAYPGYGISISSMETLREQGFLFARAGGNRAYDPLKDHPLLVPSFDMNPDTKTQIFEAFGEAHDGKIVVLTIHGVPDVEHPWVNTPPELFKEYMQYLSDNNFKVLSLRELENYMDVKMAGKLIAPDFNKKLKNSKLENVNPDTYLSELKTELQKEWPQNRTINIVFHGHSVPSGYFKTPLVNTLSAYPNQVLQKLKSIYPYSVVNVIVTGIGGENSASGAERFERDVLVHKPDLIFIDYALNDRSIGLEKAAEAWTQMITQAKQNGIPVILLTPSPDQSNDYTNPNNELRKHTNQITLLAKENQVGLVDSYKAFEFLYENKQELVKYMAQVNHPNEKGHELIANEIIKYFKK